MYESNVDLKSDQWMVLGFICYSPYAHNFIMRTRIPICKLFSNPHRYTDGDPCMHMAIPVWEILHMRIQDLIFYMEIFPICI